VRKVKTATQYIEYTKRHRKHGLSKKEQHAAPKTRCVEFRTDNGHRCLERPVDGRRCLVHGGVSPVASLVHPARPAKSLARPKPKCAGTTKENKRCSRNALDGSVYCKQHGGE
jgi:hypothetical protein